ncbi:T9SS type A sorting domain-containing protein [Nonlabens ponticola]|uniref:T9SS type A sorting domain-containing protein n=1 Tax=Nonlabens ponticola TaxID=2496866 RepID=A0A3S9MWP1_9FLAO|nr:T9SS type A sorting domain-containing protein [Nonlabens ponticola]AZQ43635.1 T9SS type A sorting domain-containing protein [Nonlabens ponticola]
MKKLLLFCALIFSAMALNAQTIGIVGPAANGWPGDDNSTPDIELTDNGDGTHTIEGLTLNTGAAKFRTNKNWDEPNYGGDTFPSGNVTGGNIPVAAGVYDITLDLNSNTYTFEDVSTFTEIELVGTADGDTAFEMATTDGVNYTLSTTQLGDTMLQFREVGTTTTYSSADFPSGTATEGGEAINSTSGFYNVSFNLETLAYSFDIPSIGLVGPGAAGWPGEENQTPDIMMSSENGDVYVLEDQVINDGDIKFRQDQDWSVNWGGTAFPEGPAVLNSGDNIPATAGTYDITFSRSNSTYTFTSSTASNDDVAFAGFKVYPNPSSDVWVFENQNELIAGVSVYDQTGKLIYESDDNALRTQFNAGSLSTGLYIAQVTLANGSQRAIRLLKK